MSRHHNALPTQLFELAFAVPVVVNARLTRMFLSGGSPSRKDQNEFFEMGAEKIEAFYESWQAVSDVITGYHQDWFTAGLEFKHLNPANSFQYYQDYQSATERMARKGLAPIHKRAVSNAKRLGKAS